MRMLLAIQLVVAVLLGSLLVVGDRGQPKVTLASALVGVTDPVVLRFDRPIERDSFERNFRLAGEEPVAGTFQWSIRSVAFLPSTPLRHGADYTVQLDDVVDEQGHHLKAPFVRTIRTSSPRFLYLTPERRLMLYLVDERRAVPISQPGQQVLDFIDKKGVPRPQHLREDDARRVFRLLIRDAGLTALV